MQKSKRILFFGILALLIVAGILLSLPSVWSRASYYAQQFYSEIKYKLFPPEKIVFTPGQNAPDRIATSVQGTLTALHPLTTPTLAPTEAPTPTLVPLPPSILLQGVKQEPQRWNNCGPATLSMALSYWGWTDPSDPKFELPQDFIAPILKPNDRDKNVMPYEMQDFVQQYTNLGVLVRMGGDLYTLKALLNAGFPVVVEKGFEGAEFEGWMGHYNLIVGYDDARQVFFTQDSYLLVNDKKSDNFEVSYASMESHWRAFNNIFLVIYPAEKQNDVLNTLGPLADEANAFHLAYERAMSESLTLSEPRDQFFALYNTGTSLEKLQDYSNAAVAYDKAFSIYPTIPDKERPWRMLWYQTGPYFAYYFTARYQDVIDLADTTLSAMSEPVLEESYHWRALAELALGNQEAAVQDLRNAIQYHADFAPSMEQLQALGVTP
ncbi:MAG: C39 family peptidase [Chloroflexi bacterium]|nr:C39 family peptidase [Chloroflexota bacterium]